MCGSGNTADAIGGWLRLGEEKAPPGLEAPAGPCGGPSVCGSMWWLPVEGAAYSARVTA